MVEEEPGNESEEDKTFKNLVTEVHETGLCGACGGCVSFCSAGELSAIGFGTDRTPEFIDEDSCLECGICYLICPQIDILDSELRKEYSWRPPFGSYKRIVSARSTDSHILSACTDGGVVSAILHCLLDLKTIDGAVVSKKTSGFSREPLIATSYNDILDAAGSRFNGITGAEELGKVSTYSPTMFAVREIANMDLLRIAVVGTPCQVHTLRKMESLNVVPSHVVKSVLGLFCFESFAFDASKIKEVERALEVRIEEIEKLNLKDDLILKLKNGRVVHVDLERMDGFVRSACLACGDFANDFADLSFGGLGSPEGWTTVVIRTDLGASMYQEALRHGYIEELSENQEEFIERLSDDCLTKITSFAQMKQNRKEKKLG
jgi:coenzyme F420 hydrogenase subunit beta